MTGLEFLQMLTSADPAAREQAHGLVVKVARIKAAEFKLDPAEADDIAQEILLKLWVSREQLADAPRAKPYIARAVTNLLIDMHRQRKRLRERQFKDEEEVERLLAEPEALDPMDDFELWQRAGADGDPMRGLAQIIRDEVLPALLTDPVKLADRQQQVDEMYRLASGESYDDLFGPLTETARNTIQARHSRTRYFLRKNLVELDWPSADKPLLDHFIEGHLVQRVRAKSK